MKFLLDTHLLLWIAADSDRLSNKAKRLITCLDNELFFSAANLWEIAIKQSLKRQDFQVDARLLRQGLLDNNYQEIQISSKQAIAIANLPPIHKDPFDRILIAQAIVEEITLLTSDKLVAQYSGPIQLV